MPGERERLDAEASCRQLMMRYAAAMDLHDLELFMTVLSPDIHWVRPGMAPMCSHVEIRMFMENLWRARGAINPNYLDVHLITTCSIEVEAADRARGATWCMMYSAPEHDGAGPAPMPAVPELIVLYRDRFVRLVDGWRIAEHEAEHLFRSPVYSKPPIPVSLQTPQG